MWLNSHFYFCKSYVIFAFYKNLVPQKLWRVLYIVNLDLTDWGIFESSFKTPHNLKAITLRNAPVDTVLAVLSGRVEEVDLGLHGWVR